MPNYAFVLLPLYIYPSPPSAWQPLFSAAKAFPDVQFQVVINPDSGPGGASCPGADFVTALSQLNAIANIQTLAYVHTAITENTCHDSTGATTICVCSQSMNALQKNITTYANWPTSKCSPGGTDSKDIHVDGIFFDEAPINADCFNYMQNVTSFAKSTMRDGNTVLYNVGCAVDPSYFSLADYVNIFEETEASYCSASLNTLTNNGKNAKQCTMIINSYKSNAAQMLTDVRNILGTGKGGAGIAGLGLSDQDVYHIFSTQFTSKDPMMNSFVRDVQIVGLRTRVM